MPAINSRSYIGGPDQQAIAHAADKIDGVLADDPAACAEEHHEGLCRMTVDPLTIQFSIDDQDRKVIVWTVRHVG